MSFSENTTTQADTRADAKHERAQNPADAEAVLAREAGVPFQPTLGNGSGIDPIAEWLSLMEVVQLLCPVWPVRYRPMKGNHWLL